MSATRLVNQLLESDEAKSFIVHGLTESSQIDPKEFSLGVKPSDSLAVDKVQDALNQVFQYYYRRCAEDAAAHLNMRQTSSRRVDDTYKEIRRTVNNLIQDLEQLLGRTALDGTRDYLVACTRKPWNYDIGHKISRSTARELLNTFKSCSKKVK